MTDTEILLDIQGMWTTVQQARPFKVVHLQQHLVADNLQNALEASEVIIFATPDSRRHHLVLTANKRCNAGILPASCCSLAYSSLAC